MIRAKRLPVHRRLLILALLLLPALACQAAISLSRPTETQIQLPSPETVAATITFTPPPTASTTPSPTPSPTPLPPSATPTLTAAPTLVITPSELQLQVFDELWQTVWESYIYPDFNGLDWEAIRMEYRPQVEAGMSDEQFYHAMSEMIFRLNDDHSAYLSPQQVEQEIANLAGENDYVGIGVLTAPVLERELATVILVFPGSPAEEIGLQSHDNILAVDGKALVDADGFHREYLRGPEGTTIQLTVQTPGEEPRQVSVTRRWVTGSTPVPYAELITPQGKRIGYLLLATFADATIDEQVGDALIALTAAGPLDGLILDNRKNGGGADIVARATLGYFTRGVGGYFIDRENHRRTFNIVGTDVNGTSRIPVVVLVGPDTASFGELSSGILKDMGEAYLIGEITGGNIELLRGFDFSDGSRAWIAHEKFVPRNHPEEDWEISGIIPDLVVPSNWDQVTLQTDPAVQAALDFFDGKE